MTLTAQGWDVFVRKMYDATDKDSVEFGSRRCGMNVLINITTEIHFTMTPFIRNGR